MALLLGRMDILSALCSAGRRLLLGPFIWLRLGLYLRGGLWLLFRNLSLAQALKGPGAVFLTVRWGGALASLHT